MRNFIKNLFSPSRCYMFFFSYTYDADGFSGQGFRNDRFWIRGKITHEKIREIENLLKYSIPEIVLPENHDNLDYFNIVSLGWERIWE